MKGAAMAEFAERTGGRKSAAKAPSADTSSTRSPLNARRAVTQAKTIGERLNARAATAIQRQPARSNGLPEPLRTSMEAVSGIALHDVTVHRNSDKPGQLQAHAYAQGTDIHLAPGQDKHLAHEAWHVVQQKRGQVRSTTSIAGVGINDDRGLEAEADQMGALALRTNAADAPVSAGQLPPGGHPVQRTMVVVAYQSTDSMFNATINATPAPFPIHFFDKSGTLIASYANKAELLTEDAKTLLKGTDDLNPMDGEDRTKVTIVAHGGAGTLESVALGDLLKGMDALKEKVITAETTEVKLGICLSMTRRHIDDKSIALRIAEWIQGNLQREVEGATAKLREHLPQGGDAPDLVADYMGTPSVELLAGYTSSTGGELGAGRPAFDRFDKRTKLEMQPIEAYLFHAVRTRIRAMNANSDKKLSLLGLTDDATFAKDDLLTALFGIIELAPAVDRSREPGKRFQISAEAIGGLDELTRGHVVADVQEGNFTDFPERFIDMEKLEPWKAQITKLLSDKVDKLVGDRPPAVVAPSTAEPKTAEQLGISFGSANGASDGTKETPTPHFGFVPTFGVGAQPGTGFSFGVSSVTDTAPSFSFGVSSATDTGPSFSFGFPSVTDTASGFSFGVPLSTDIAPNVTFGPKQDTSKKDEPEPK
jgi:hypothetical protein